MIHRQKTRVVSGCAGLMVLMGAAALSAEMHIQCKKSRCALPARNYTTREPVMGATVTSPLTATISVDQVLPASKSALVPLDELDAQQLADQLRQTPTVVSGNVPVAPLQDLQGLFSRGGRIPASVSGGPQIVPSAELLGTEAELREAAE